MPHDKPDPAEDLYRGYHQFVNEHGDAYGSFEVFWDDQDDGGDGNRIYGWYWWPCMPGCLPDGEPTGPFRTSGAAYDDAMGN